MGAIVNGGRMMRRSLSVVSTLITLVLAVAFGGLVQRVSAAQDDSPDAVPAEQLWGLKVFTNSHYTAPIHYRLEIVDNEKLRVTGREPSIKAGWRFYLRASGAGSLLPVKGPFDYEYDPSDGSYSGEVDLVKDPIDGIYRVEVRLEHKERRIDICAIRAGYVACRAGDVFFLASPAYEDNCIAYAENSRVDPGDYLRVGIGHPKDWAEIESLAKSVVAGASSDYERLLRIHNWVAGSIYYNWDGYRSGDYGDMSITGILKTKTTVCSGYARLTEALLRSVGIPSRVINGHVLGAGTDGGTRWDSIEHAEAHVWNEAYVDGRWVIMDVTWDSLNIFENGEFIKKGLNYDYFDMSLEYLSLKHRIRLSP